MRLTRANLFCGGVMRLTRVVFSAFGCTKPMYSCIFFLSHSCSLCVPIGQLEEADASVEAAQEAGLALFRAAVDQDASYARGETIMSITPTICATGFSVFWCLCGLVVLHSPVLTHLYMPQYQNSHFNDFFVINIFICCIICRPYTPLPSPLQGYHLMGNVLETQGQFAEAASPSGWRCSTGAAPTPRRT